MPDRVEDDFEFDVALSLAGEDRAYVRPVAEQLRDYGVRVFYEYRVRRQAPVFSEPSRGNTVTQRPWARGRGR